MRKLIGLVALLVAILGFNVSYGAEFELPESSYEFYVYDETGTIEESLKNEIIATNRALQDKAGAQIVVAVVKDTEGSSGAQEYANKLFEKWEIGDREKDNGILFLVSKDEKTLWIEVGYGLEGALPDGKVGGIRDEYIIPYFESGDYNSGIKQGFYALTEEVAREYGIDELNIEEPIAVEEESKEGRGLGDIVLVAGFILLIALDFMFFGGTITMLLIRMFLGGRGGGGSSGGSSRGSGGGGSSGGGGAGGSW